MKYGTDTTILGPSMGDVNGIIDWVIKRGAKRPDEVSKLLNTLATYAPQFGIRFEVAVAQCLQECSTNAGVPFANNWWVDNLNAASIGITGDPIQNAASRVFPSGRNSALAQLVHLFLYAKGTDLPSTLIGFKTEDWRWDVAVDAGRAGVAKTLLGLANTYAEDPAYATGILKHLNAMQAAGLLDKPVASTKDIPVPTGLPQNDTGQTTAPKPSTVYAPVKLLPLLDQKTGKSLFERDAFNAYFGIDQDVFAIRDTPLLQTANAGSRLAGDAKKDSRKHAGWGWVDKAGVLYLYASTGERLLGKDWRTASGQIKVPDPSPLPPTPVPAPTDPTKITALNYKTVANPKSLLPDIVWAGSPNFFPGRSGAKPVSIFYHITDDMNLDSTLSWFANNTSQASSHFVIDRDGTVYQCVSSLDGAWTNGDVQNYRQDIPWMDDIISTGANLNNYTISYEHVGTPSIPPTKEQYASSIALSRYFCHPDVYNINPNRSHHNRHADANGNTRAYCPGDDFELEYIITELGGDPTEMTA